MVSETPVLKVRRLHPEVQLPVRATEGASGLDVYACLPDGDMVLGPDPVRVPTGVALEMLSGSSHVAHSFSCQALLSEAI